MNTTWLSRSVNSCTVLLNYTAFITWVIVFFFFSGYSTASTRSLSCSLLPTLSGTNVYDDWYCTILCRKKNIKKMCALPEAECYALPLQQPRPHALLTISDCNSHDWLWLSSSPGPLVRFPSQRYVYQSFTWLPKAVVLDSFGLIVPSCQLQVGCVLYQVIMQLFTKPNTKQHTVHASNLIMCYAQKFKINLK